jgi:hypothetical protein
MCCTATCRWLVKADLSSQIRVVLRESESRAKQCSSSTNPRRTRRAVAPWLSLLDRTPPSLNIVGAECPQRLAFGESCSEFFCSSQGRKLLECGNPRWRNASTPRGTFAECVKAANETRASDCIGLPDRESVQELNHDLLQWGPMLLVTTLRHREDRAVDARRADSNFGTRESQS